MSQEDLNQMAQDTLNKVGAEGIVTRAIMIVEFVDAEDGLPTLTGLVSEGTTYWQALGLIEGIRDYIMGQQK